MEQSPAGTEHRLPAGPGSGYLLPGLELRHPDGQPAPLWAYRGRGPLVVYLHEVAAPDGQGYLAMLAAARRRFEELGARVVVVASAPVGGVPLISLVDPTQRLAQRLAADGLLPQPAPPAILVVGRTGEVWAVWAGSYATLPGQPELEEWLEYALSECRECFCCELVWPSEWLRG